MALFDKQFISSRYVRFSHDLSVFSESLGKEDIDLTNSSSRLSQKSVTKK